MRLLILLLIPNFLLALELNLLCTNSYPRTKDLDVKDMFLLLDSDTKKIDRELFFAMNKIKNDGVGPKDQLNSFGCSIKWKTNE